jgi:hypothetical protein
MRIGSAGIVACALIGAPAALAQDRVVQVSGHVRVRYEALEGQPRAGLTPSDEQIAIRSVVLLEADPAGPLSFGAQLQDSRAYLGKPGSAISTNDVNALELNQAYVGVDLGDALGRGSRTRIQAGRMLTNVSSRRLVAGDEYRNASNAYTGIRADISTPGTGITAFYLLPQTRLPEAQAEVIDKKVEIDRESFDVQLWGAYLARPKLSTRLFGEIGYVGFAERDAPGRPTRDRRLHSIEARLLREPAADKADFELDGIYQFGRTRTGTAAAAPQLDVSAWFLHAEAGYSPAHPWKPRIALEYDYASGDGPGARYGRFDTLYGMRRGDLAPAGIYNAIGRANIHTLGIRAEAMPSPRWDVFVTYRPMWLASRTDAFSTTGVRDASGGSGSFAGHQFDSRVRLWVVPKRLRAEFTGVMLWKGAFLRNAPNAQRTGNTRYGSAALTLSF